MPVFVAGLNHRSAPLDLLERLAIDPERRPKALALLLEREHVKEGVILSTCNRVEVYAAIERFHDGGDAVRGFLTEFHGTRSHELSDYLYAHYEDRAVNHLFAVTAGIDSMVVGEVQILGQVREAFQAVSLQVAEGQLGTLAGRSVLIVGAGKMAKLASRTMREAGVSELVIANRTAEHGATLAAELGGRSVPLEAIDQELATADLVVASTAAVDPTVTLQAVRRGLDWRGGGRPLVMLDLGVPRDVEPEVRQLPGVVLADLDALRAVLETEDEDPRREVDRVRVLIGEETAGFMSGQRSAKLAPTIRALRARAEGVRQYELARASTRLAGLDAVQRAAVDAVTRGLVNKLLHDPIVRGKALAAGANGEMYAGILRQLYALDEEDPHRAD